MINLASLFKKATVFEKVAVYGSQKDFLASLGQSLSNGAVAFPDELVSNCLSATAGSAHNVLRELEQRQESSTLAETVKNIAAHLDQALIPSYVSSKPELDQKANPLKAVLGNSIYVSTQLAALKGATPSLVEMGGQLKAEAQKCIEAINVFYQKQGFPVAEVPEANPTQNPITLPDTVITPSGSGSNKGSLSETAKNLAKNLTNKVSVLPQDSQRPAHLQQLDAGIKNLLGYFKNLQQDKSLPAYFARMEIADSLQNIYNSLQYEDLASVKSLNYGKNIPESPDSKI